MSNEQDITEEFFKKCQAEVLGTSCISNKSFEYLNAKRHLNISSIKKNNIGYCSHKILIPDEIKHFGETNLDDLDNNFIDARNFSYYIKNRIIVPIYSEFGELISFATRSFEIEDSSWWNAPFVKGHHLFNLNSSKKDIFKKNKVYLVEGYIDALILSQYGLENVCAIMGTKLSTIQIGRILRYCNNICFCFDWDSNKSGQKATINAIKAVKQLNAFDSISFMDKMPLDIDPDEYVVSHGLDNLLKHEQIFNDDFNKYFQEIINETK